MKKLSFVVLFIFVLLGVSDVYAHPGRTDANGCHTCRSNCSRWGLSYGQYHCHNGGGSVSSSNNNSSSSNSGSSYSSKPKSIYGCTDSNSINYNSSANVDDGSCIKKVYGCTKSDAYNYNSSANVDDGSCISKVYGCIDEDADNYNKDANTSDGSCLYTKYKTTYKKIKYMTSYKHRFFAKNGKVIRKGKYGKRKIKTKIVYDEQNNIINSKIVNNKVVTKPVSKIIVRNK